MKINQIKLFVVVIFTLPIFALAFFNAIPVRAVANLQTDAAATFKTKCQACHTAKAEKFFDPAKTDEVLVETILKGRKGEKPPYMPSFEAKGMTAEEAKSLVAFMKQLRTPSN